MHPRSIMRLRGLGNQASSSSSHGRGGGTRIPALALSTLSSSFSTSRKKGRKSDNAMIFNYQYRMGEPNSRLLRSMSSWERTVSHADKYHCFGKSSFWRTYVLKLLRSARFIRLDESESSAANEELTACHTSNSQGWDAMGKYQQQTIMKIRHTI